MESNPAVQRALAVCANLQQTITSPQVHDLLRTVAGLLGECPRQVVDAPLRVRWVLYADQHRSDGEIVEVTLTPQLAGGELRWGIAAKHHESLTLLRDEHRALDYQGDPHLGGPPPYHYNLAVGGYERWDNDLITELSTWSDIEHRLGDIISNLAANLAALPGDWFDVPVLITTGTNLWVKADRRALRVAVDSGENGDLWSHYLLFTPERALLCGRLVTRTAIAMLGDGWPVSDLDLQCGSADPRRSPVSGFRTPRSAQEKLPADPGRRFHIAELTDLAVWSTTTDHYLEREKMLASFPDPAQFASAQQRPEPGVSPSVPSTAAPEAAPPASSDTPADKASRLPRWLRLGRTTRER